MRGLSQGLTTFGTVFDVAGGELLVEGFQLRQSAFRKSFVTVTNVDDDSAADISFVEDFDEGLVVAVVVAEQVNGGHFLEDKSGSNNFEGFVHGLRLPF